MKPTRFRQHTYVTPEFFDYLDVLVEAMESGITPTVVSPGTAIGSSAAAINAAIVADGLYSYSVAVKVCGADGEILNGFDGEKLSVSVTKSSTGGTVAIVGGLTEVEFAKGIATFNVVYTGTWAAADTATIKIGYGDSADSVLGQELTPAQVKDTFIE